MHPYRYTIFDALSYCLMKYPIVVFDKNTNSRIRRAKFADFRVFKILNSLLANVMLLENMLPSPVVSHMRSNCDEVIIKQGDKV